MKSIDPSDAFNSLAPPVPDYNKTKINLSHSTCHFTNKLYEKKRYGSARYSSITIILFPNISNE